MQSQKSQGLEHGVSCGIDQHFNYLSVSSWLIKMRRIKIKIQKKLRIQNSRIAFCSEWFSFAPAISAIHWPVSFWLERNFAFFLAICACRLVHCSWSHISSSVIKHFFSPLCLQRYLEVACIGWLKMCGLYKHMCKSIYIEYFLFL